MQGIGCSDISAQWLLDPILAGTSNQDKPEKRHRLKYGIVFVHQMRKEPKGCIYLRAPRNMSARALGRPMKNTYKESHFNRRLQPGQARGKARVKIMGFVLCVLFCCQWMSERASQAPLCDSKPCADEPPNPLDMNDEISQDFKEPPQPGQARGREQFEIKVFPI